MTRGASVILAAVSIAATLLTAEAMARLYYHRTYGLPFGASPAALLYAYYPELQPAMAPAPPGQPEVLLLGASVLNRTFGDVAPRLHDALTAAWGTDVRVVNVSMLGHGTLDSYYKYRSLADRRFDLVIVYHAINELRANNVPPEYWRDDYGHYVWYDEVNFYFGHERWRALPFMLPFFANHAVTELDQTVVHHRRYVPMHTPDPDWLAYGAVVRTAPVFRRNIERILALAAARSDPVMLMTFAYHLPEDYTPARFQRGQMGFGSWSGSSPSPAEIWGTPEHVRAGLAVHDGVLRDLHAAHPDALFVDQEARLGADPANFVDVCHLSPAGTERFVAGIADAVRERGLVPRPHRRGNG